jgi:integrase
LRGARTAAAHNQRTADNVPKQTDAHRQVERLLAEHGEKRVTKLERRHMRAMMDDLAGKPGAQRDRLTVIRALIAPGVEDGLMADPTAGFERPALSKTGWRDWPEELIAQYEAHHAIGTDARLALGLGLYTAQRRADVVRMGKQHVKDGWLSVTQQKTGTSLPIPVDLDCKYCSTTYRPTG